MGDFQPYVSRISLTLIDSQLITYPKNITFKLLCNTLYKHFLLTKFHNHYKNYCTSLKWYPRF